MTEQTNQENTVREAMLHEFIKEVIEKEGNLNPATSNFEQNIKADVPEEEVEPRMMLAGAFDEGYRAGIYDILNYIEKLNIHISVTAKSESEE